MLPKMGNTYFNNLCPKVRSLQKKIISYVHFGRESILVPLTAFFCVSPDSNPIPISYDILKLNLDMN